MKLLLVSLLLVSICGCAKSQSERYVLGQTSTSQKEQYVLDSITGRLWIVTLSDKGRILVPSRFWCGKANGIDKLSWLPTCENSFDMQKASN